MEVTVNRAELLDALKKSQKVIKTGRRAHPFVKSVHLSAFQNTLAIRAMDFSLYVEKRLSVELVRHGDITVDHKQITALVSSFSDSYIRLYGYKDVLSIIGSDHSELLAANITNDYPVLPHIPTVGEKFTEILMEHEIVGNEVNKPTRHTYIPLQIYVQEFEIPQYWLASMLSQVAIVATNDDSWPMFKCVRTELRDSLLTLTACGEFRFSYRTMAVSGSWIFDALIPAKEYVRAVNALPKDGQIKLSTFYAKLQLVEEEGKEVINADPFIRPLYVRLSFDNTAFYVRLHEGAYPNLQWMGSQEQYITRAVVETKELLEAVKEAASMRKAGANRLDIEARGNTLTVSAKNEKNGVVNKSVPTETHGPDVKVALNAKYVLDILKVTDHPEIVLSFRGNNQPVRFSNVGNRNEVYVYVVMPISLQDK